jgi:hypothetical protein
MVALVALAAAASCGRRDGTPTPAEDATAPVSARDAAVAARAASIHVSLQSYDFSRSPYLLERVRDRTFGYFRFTNIPFSQAVCDRFRSQLRTMPTVNLHGDAHVENYAVTGDGRGLADFDDSSAGPAVIDLVRFGVSIRLATRERGWEASADDINEEFLRGYRAALQDDAIKRPIPGFVQRARAQFRRTREQFLVTADLLMTPMPASERVSFERGYSRYAEMILRDHPDLHPRYFEIQRMGRLSVGFGSALDTKYLMRIRGPTDSPDDDAVLEAKQVRDLRGIDCINPRAGGGAFRILIGQARIAEVPQRFLAQIPRVEGDDPTARPFWIHAWFDHYAELDVQGDIGPQDLREIAYDVGIQLGRGHVRQIASPLDSQLRQAQLDTLRDL